jgi:hypothetical protein
VENARRNAGPKQVARFAVWNCRASQPRSGP